MRRLKALTAFGLIVGALISIAFEVISGALALPVACLFIAGMMAAGWFGFDYAIDLLAHAVTTRRLIVRRGPR